jgi:outer membrane immunogenic protein
MKIRTWVLTAASLAIGAFSAQAADMPIATKAPYVPAPVFSWTGCYIGGHVGWISGRSDIRDEGYYDSGATNSLHANSFVIGGQGGCNYQTGSLVVGVEADGSWLDASHTTSGYYADQSTKWNSLVTVRGRAGLAVDRTMFYVTAGGAWADVNTIYNTNVIQGNLDGIASSTGKFGWVAGVGIEHAITPNWTVKLEGLYVRLTDDDTHHLGTTTCSTSRGPDHACNFTFNHDAAIVRLGANYKFY